MTNILETPRLLLRHLVINDLDDLFALYQDSQIRKYFPEGILNYQDTKEELEWHMNGHSRHPELGLWATIHKETGKFIGCCGLLPWTIEGQYDVEVAYTITEEYWGQGLGSETAQGILNYGFEKLNLSRMICIIDPNNSAPQAVAQKIGMSYEKEAHDELGTFSIYSIVRKNDL